MKLLVSSMLIIQAILLGSSGTYENKELENEVIVSISENAIEIDEENVFHQEMPFEKYDEKYYIELAEETEDFLGDFNKVIEFDTLNSEYDILIWSDETIASIKVMSIQIDNSENPEKLFGLSDKELEYEYQNLYPQEGLILKVSIPEGIPTRRIILTDLQGEEYSFVPQISGKDGRFFAMPFSI